MSNLRFLTDAENQTTELRYDNLNQLWQEIRPMGEVTRYWYTDAGNLEEKQDANGQRIEYSYEPDTDLLREIRYYDSADTQTRLLSFSYDARSGNLTGYNDGTTSAAYTYDDLGRKLTETVNYPGFSKTFSYSYDAVGLKRSFAMPGGPTYSYTYDATNQLKTIRIPGEGTISYPSYTMGRPDSVSFPGGSTQSYQYDALMRLERIQTPNLDYAYMKYEYTSYDNLSNILTKSTEHGNYVYDYDDVYRLTSADNPVLDDDAFTYDGVGNRETASNVTTGMITHNDNNELALYGDISYEYDANGNMVRKSLGTAAILYTYNVANRLVKVEDEAGGTVIAEYVYDPFGRRLWKEVGGERTYFMYADEGLVAEYDATGAEIRSYGYQPESTWTTDPLWLKEDGAYYWYQNDHLGTPQKLVAQNGAVVWSAQYSAFGEAQIEVETVTNNLRFPGQYEDAETGLLYNFHRYYDPGLGRYLRIDPIGFGGGDVNIYTYAKDNPLTQIDLFGMASLTEVQKGTLYYTWHMGWLDEYHAFKNLGGPSLKEAWERLEKARDGEQVGFKLQQAGAIASSEGYFCLHAAPKNSNNPHNPLINRKNQLLHAWMVITDKFEKAQGKLYLDRKLPNELGGIVLKHNIDQQPSAFSTEDLVSNLIFFYTIIDDMERDEVDRLAGRFDPQDDPDLSKAIWIYGFKTRPGHTTWMDPQYLDYDQLLQFSFGEPPEPSVDTDTLGLSQLLARAQQNLLKYKKRYGTPDFPSEFEVYRRLTDGYISISGKNMWKNYPLLPQVEYW